MAGVNNKPKRQSFGLGDKLKVGSCFCTTSVNNQFEHCTYICHKALEITYRFIHSVLRTLCVIFQINVAV